jgi:hypothetical protein
MSTRAADGAGRRKSTRTRTVVHVNRHNIAANRTRGAAERLPVFTIKKGRTNVYAHAVRITGTVRLVYDPDRPLSCGAVAYIVTDGLVEPVGDTVTPAQLRGGADACSSRR